MYYDILRYIPMLSGMCRCISDMPYVAGHRYILRAAAEFSCAKVQKSAAFLRNVQLGA